MARGFDRHPRATGQARAGRIRVPGDQASAVRPWPEPSTRRGRGALASKRILRPGGKPAFPPTR